VDEIATRAGAHVHTWVDDGLGPARGLACRLANGDVFVMVEHELSIRYSHSRGPNVLVDASVLAAAGADALVAELKKVLRLSESEVEWIAGPESVQSAARFVDESRSRSKAKDAEIDAGDVRPEPSSE
jgi:hypothetical protein